MLGKVNSSELTFRRSGSEMNLSENEECSSSQLCPSGESSNFLPDTTLHVVIGQKLRIASALLLAHLPPSRAGRALGNLWRVLIGQPNPAKYLLPEGYGDCMDTFFEFAKQLGMHTASVAEVIAPFTMWDAYHFRDDSCNRKILADWLACVANVLACEDQVSFLKIEDIQHVARRFPYQHHGLIMNQMQFNETVNKHMQSATLPKHHPEEVELNPWDYAEEEAVEIEILEGMRYIKAPPQIVNQQLSQMVYIGDAQYVPKEDADSEFLAKVRAKMEAARDEQAALAGRPSSSGVRSTPQKLTKEQIMSASPYGQDSTLQIVAKDHKRLEETRKRKAKEDAEAKAAEEAQAALDEQAALAGRPTPMQPAKLRVLPPITPKEKKEMLESVLGFDRADDYAFLDCVPEGALAGIERAGEFDSPDDIRLATCEQGDLGPIASVPMSHGLKTYLSGLIRGKIPDKRLLFSGAWVSVQNLLDVFNASKKQHWSTKALISLVAYDNKARFVFRGDPEDPRASLLDQPMFPIFIRAAQGQSKNLEFEDSDIAKHWYSWKSRAQLGDHAAFEGRPLIPMEDVPPRLYHRTVRDAAFAILNSALEPGRVERECLCILCKSSPRGNGPINIGRQGRLPNRDRLRDQRGDEVRMAHGKYQ